MSDKVTCVFVHGWAMNSAVWDEVIDQLPDWIDAVLVDLPGHGSMVDVEADSLDDYVQTLSSLVHRPVMWVGWSLGGLAVLRLAEIFPQRVAAVLLVATNPCFVRQRDWSYAVDATVFSQFKSELAAQQDKTIRRFLALQVKGLSNAVTIVKKLQNSIDSRGQASAHALVSGLDILLHTDMREALKNIDAPLHWCFGAKDGLVPVALVEELEKKFSQKNIVLNVQASHVPFISHREIFIKQLIECAESVRGHHASV